MPLFSRSQFFAAALLASITLTAFSSEVKQSRDESGAFIGSIGCKSSSCHGGAGEKRSQHITWSRQDFHSRAYAILLDARSSRIAETVGAAAAQSSARCTVCHSPFQSVEQTRLASTAHPDEGVSCESCHGAAGSWLRGHTRPDWTYEMRVRAGMRDLRNLYGRANTCVACHQNIDHDLLKAGHPTLVFELDSQTVNEPKHWMDEDPWIGPRSWITGQAVALREAAWRSRVEPDPGPDPQQTSLALAWLLAKVTVAEPGLPKIVEPGSSDLEPLQKQADELARRAPNWNPTPDSVRSLLRIMVGAHADFGPGKQISQQTGFYRARRLVLGIDRLIFALNTVEKAGFKVDKELHALQDETRFQENFRAENFAERLRDLAQALPK